MQTGNELPSYRLDGILVADDLARENKGELPAAGNLAAALAEAFGARVHLVHAYTLPDFRVPTQSMTLIEGPYVESLERAIESGRQSLVNAATLAPAAEGAITASIEKGEVIDVVLDDISARNAQLVIVGTHGRHGVKRALLGSAAEEIVRRSPVPVLTVNPHWFEDRAELPFRPARILVSVDFTETAGSTLAVAAAFAERFGAELVAIHVIEEWAYPIVQSASLLAGGFVMPLEKDLGELANARFIELNRLTEPYRSAGLRVQIKIIERSASVAGAVLETAKGVGADLIVLGNRHASRLEYAVLGSTSRQVIREAHCPVLTVPALGAEVALPASEKPRKSA